MVPSSLSKGLCHRDEERGILTIGNTAPRCMELTMSYAELIERLQALPEAKQAEVFDFVEFLASRNQPERSEEQTLAKSALAEMINNPLRVPGFIPLSREDANAR